MQLAASEVKGLTENVRCILQFAYGSNELTYQDCLLYHILQSWLHYGSQNV